MCSGAGSKGGIKNKKKKRNLKKNQKGEKIKWPQQQVQKAE